MVWSQIHWYPSTTQGLQREWGEGRTRVTHLRGPRLLLGAGRATQLVQKEKPGIKDCGMWNARHQTKAQGQPCVRWAHGLQGRGSVDRWVRHSSRHECPACKAAKQQWARGLHWRDSASQARGGPQDRGQPPESQSISNWGLFRERQFSVRALCSP